ncbi:hypothetical protein JRO89_XS07G0055300 [Xanthoceras sorbifolium]|uniref:Cytochrome P450 CYP82D47-like n=1 Tax=Xanthoceras sorbifolium TaxID=99658 RepID=A0ABQ8HSL5_9ROSI|nr:hypothetical protein JRO89_XS07G0055300 [Xanthoceras sorbifolium]
MDFLFQYLNTVTIGVIAILVFSYYILIRRSNFKGPKAPEAAGKWPVIGHLHQLTGTGTRLPHFVLGELADRYGPVFSIRIGVHPALVVSSWEVAKELFTKYDVDVASRPKLTVGKLLGYNNANFGFSPYDAYWREMRKITALELLSNRRLELLKDIRVSEVENTVKETYKLWTTQKRNGSSGGILVDMQQWFGDMNLNVILKMVAGKKYFGGGGGGAESDEKEVRRCRKAMREFFDLAGIFVLRDAVPYLGWLDLGGYEKAMKKTAKELDSLAQEWLEDHRRKREAGEQAAANEDQDFMDVLLSALDGTDLPGYDADTIIKATSTTIIVGGTDTTSVNLSWALSLLLNNRHTLEKVQEELDNIVGKERLMTESDIEKLVYLQAVVKETMRLYPAGPLSGAREFGQDCTIGGYHVPKGTRLVVNLWKLQTDPRVWSDPLEFKPERFLTTHKDVDVKGQHFELIPFGAGRRACPGIAFALQMTHLGLASLLQAYEVSTPSNTAVDMTGTPGLTNTRANPLHVLLQPRLPLHLYE